jgi:alpha-galactosidase
MRPNELQRRAQFNFVNVLLLARNAVVRPAVLSTILILAFLQTAFIRKALFFLATLCVAISGERLFGQSNIRTPAAPAAPRVNGPAIFGVRPGTPFLYKIPATGNGTLQYAANNLPAGLAVDPSSGMITGSLTTPGEYDVTLQVSNSAGVGSKDFRIEVGSTIQLTPALGWNSWNCWGNTVTEAKVLTAAQAMASSGLINYGWSYVNTDDGWQAPRGGAYNALQGNANYPDMQGMVNQIHQLGLKSGVYSTPWMQSYAGFPGGSSNNPQGAFTTGHSIGTYHFAQNDAAQWAAWGVDYLKYDWYPNQLAETQEMANALQTSGRNIVFSLSNRMPLANIGAIAPVASSWRTTSDISDSWSSISSIGFNQSAWTSYSSPGHFNDMDMLVVGYVGWGATQHPTSLTSDEQYTELSLWSLESSPLLLGNDLTRMDAFTMNLLTNREVLAVDQDPLGRAAVLASDVTVGGNELRVYVKTMEDGSKVVGLFNLGSTAGTVTANWSSLGISGSQEVRDLWRQIEKGRFNASFSAAVASHGSELFSISAPYCTKMNNSLNLTQSGSWVAGVVPSGSDEMRWDDTMTGPNVVSLGASLSLGKIHILNPGGDVAISNDGNTLTLVGVNGTGIDMSRATENLTVSCPITLGSAQTWNVGLGRKLNVVGGVNGSYGLIKAGSGTLSYGGSVTYTGSTQIEQGELLVNGSLVSPVTVNAGSVLGGTGSLTSIAVNSGGTLAPGDATGAMNISGSLTLLSGAAMEYELDTPLDSGEIFMPSGLLSLSAQQFSDFNFTPLSGFGPGTYTLIDAGSTSGSLGSGTNGTIDGFPASIAVQGETLVLNVVPEPGTLTLGGACAVALTGCILRRQLGRKYRGPKRLRSSALMATIALLPAGAVKADVFNMPAGQTSLQFVTVGDPGNVADSTVMNDGTSGYGSVPYTFNMGKYDVTLAQYTLFLNAVAKTDAYGLYNQSMGNSFATQGISRSGSSGSYAYSFTGSNPQVANIPLYAETWGDAARFCNWLQNGQGTAATVSQAYALTETGAYSLNGAVTGSALTAVVRNGGARYFIPTENEWYKAAYYKSGGGNAGYWTYAMQSNVAPSNSLALAATSTNDANFYLGGYTDPINYLTPVGTFAASPSAYGTFDESGDEPQWNELALFGGSRGVRGGSYYSTIDLASSGRGILSPASEGTIGFRVASSVAVPEPTGAVLLAVGLCLIGYEWRRRKRPA